MKQRSLLRVFVLNIVTLGLYFVYWLVMTRREMLQAGAKKIPSVWLMVGPSLAFLIVYAVYFALLFANSGSTTDDNLFDGNSAGGSALSIFLFLAGVITVVASIVLPFSWLWRYSAGVEVVTNKHTERDYAFWLGVLLWIVGVPIVWQLMMQHAFNKVAAGTGLNSADSNHFGSTPPQPPTLPSAHQPHNTPPQPPQFQ